MADAAHALKATVDAERRTMRAEAEIDRLREQLRVKQQRISDLEATVRLMRSRVDAAPAPFGKGMEIRVLVSAHDLVAAYDPHAIIDHTIDSARHKLHDEARRLGLTQRSPQMRLRKGWRTREMTTETRQTFTGPLDVGWDTLARRWSIRRNGMTIAHVGNPDFPVQEEAGDARLLAAAPEMYEALVELLACKHCLAGGLDEPRFTEMVNRASSALAKAEGRP